MYRMVAVLLALLTTSNASAAPLPDGTYHCTLSSFYLGAIELDAGNYRGPAFDGNYEGSYPYEVTDGNTVNWHGPLGGLSSDGNEVVSTVLKASGGDKIGFDILIRNSRGNFQTVSCGP